jgi:hypothetical protein
MSSVFAPTLKKAITARIAMAIVAPHRIATRRQGTGGRHEKVLAARKVRATSISTHFVSRGMVAWGGACTRSRRILIPEVQSMLDSFDSVTLNCPPLFKDVDECGARPVGWAPTLWTAHSITDRRLRVADRRTQQRRTRILPAAAS